MGNLSPGGLSVAEVHSASWTLVGNPGIQLVVRYSLGLCVIVGCKSCWQVDPRASMDGNGHMASPGTAWISSRSERIQKFRASAYFSGTCCPTNTTKQTFWSLLHAQLRARSHWCLFMNNCGCFKCIWNWPGNNKALFLVHTCYFTLNLQVRCPSTT